MDSKKLISKINSIISSPIFLFFDMVTLYVMSVIYFGVGYVSYLGGLVRFDGVYVVWGLVLIALSLAWALIGSYIYYGGKVLE